MLLTKNVPDERLSRNTYCALIWIPMVGFFLIVIIGCDFLCYLNYDKFMFNLRSLTSHGKSTTTDLDSCSMTKPRVVKNDVSQLGSVRYILSGLHHQLSLIAE